MSRAFSSRLILGSDVAPALDLRHVEAGYDGKSVLQDLSLTVNAGEVYALLGANGAGKSTVARVACGLLPVRRGQVNSGDRTKMRGRIGLAPQDSALFPALSPRENVEMTARLCGVGRSERRAAVDRALALTGCGPRADQPVRTLSGGWRRRANLSAALVGQPRLLIADEPTEGVDAGTRGVLSAALRETAKAGAGCLLISHDAIFVADTADRIGVLSQGRLLAEGAPSQLLHQAFGAARLLSVRLARPASEAASQWFGQAGLTPTDDGLEWSRICEDALAVAQMLDAVVDGEGGEVAVRRPGLDDLVERLSETQS
jgi:ABC-2 type transport system ATP-binding protein